MRYCCCLINRRVNPIQPIPYNQVSELRHYLSCFDIQVEHVVERWLEIFEMRERGCGNGGDDGFAAARNVLERCLLWIHREFGEGGFAGISKGVGQDVKTDDLVPCCFDL